MNRQPALEEITVHRVPLAEARAFAESRSEAGALVHPKIIALLYLA